MNIIRLENPKIQAEIVKKLENIKPIPGSTWYVLDMRFWRAWKAHTHYQPNFLGLSVPELPELISCGAIDNSSLIEPDVIPYFAAGGVLKKFLLEHYDFIVVPEEIYTLLYGWYGGGPALPRDVIPSGNGNWFVELRPFRLNVYQSNNIHVSVSASFSRNTTIREFKYVMCELFKLNPKRIRVWDHHIKLRYKLLEDERITLEGAQVIDGQDMLLEEDTTQQGV